MENHRKIILKIHEIKSILLEYSGSENYGLMGGSAGIALFLAYYSRYFNHDASIRKFNSLLASSISYIQNIEIPLLTFCDGISGFAWTLNHLNNNNFIKIEATSSEINELVFRFSEFEINRKNYDYLHGGMGSVLFFNNQIHTEINKERIKKLINQMDSISVKKFDTVFWIAHFYNSESLYEIEFPDEFVNLGLAHGVPSILLLLNKCKQMLPNYIGIRKIIIGSVNYLLSMKNDSHSISYFPAVNISRESSRLAWCYGDLGIGVALYQAAIALHDNELKKIALEVMLSTTARRNLMSEGVVDAGLCHGTAGIAHIYRRMFHYTQMDKFKNAADYWYDETLKMAKFDDGLAGFKSYQGSDDGWVNEYGLLEGIAGIGLSLISALPGIE
jgi:lantibiotic modifying enzyme